MLSGFAGEDDAARDAVRAACASDDDAVRARALGAALRRGLYEDERRVAALRDPSPRVRRRACELEARAPSRGARVVDALLSCLLDEDPLVVVRAATALGEAGEAGRAAVGQLASVARSHPDPRCREAGVAALGSLGDERGRGAVLDALSDRPAVRRRAAVALAAFEGADVDAAIDRAREDRDWQVREIADALYRGESAD